MEQLVIVCVSMVLNSRGKSLFVLVEYVELI